MSYNDWTTRSRGDNTSGSVHVSANTRPVIPKIDAHLQKIFDMIPGFLGILGFLGRKRGGDRGCCYLEKNLPRSKKKKLDNQGLIVLQSGFKKSSKRFFFLLKTDLHILIPFERPLMEVITKGENLQFIDNPLHQGCPQVVAWGDFFTYSCHLRHLLFHIF